LRVSWKQWFGSAAATAAAPAPPAQPIRSKRIWQNEFGKKKIGGGSTQSSGRIRRGPRAREEIAESACARFSTVLGPGSDGNHEEHIHVDLAERHGGYKMCEWEVREPIKQAEQTVPQTEGPVAALTGPVPLPHPRPAMSMGSITKKPARPSGERSGQAIRNRARFGAGPFAFIYTKSANQDRNG
jgi:hypothetical protein